MNSVKIRQFEQRDTNVVIQLANDFAFFDGPTTEEDLKITHAFPEGFIVAEEDGNVVGLAYGYFREVPKEVLDNWGVSKVATIELLVVDPKYREHGIGTSLIDSLIGIFKKVGADMIGLTCPVGASYAKHLYENQGFKISAYHMRKKLD
ncbi:MAG: GNAT family N-acetyltransferase [Candidatus Thorarchaeota archaeon]